MIQTSFIDAPPRPVHSGSATSRAAAEQIEPHAGTQRAAILAYIREHDGATRQELCLALNMPNNSVCPRVIELLKMHLIRATTATRPTTSGRAAVVLEATR